MIQDRTSVFPKAFIDLTRALSEVLKVALRYMRFFDWQGVESVIFRASLVVQKYSLCLTL